MKSLEKNFDRLVAYAKRVNSDWNFFLFYGYLAMATSIVAYYVLNTRTAVGLGMTGLAVGYIGVIISVLAYDKRSRKAKLAMIIAIPLFIAFMVQLYR